MVPTNYEMRPYEHSTIDAIYSQDSCMSPTLELAPGVYFVFTILVLFPPWPLCELSLLFKPPLSPSICYSHTSPLFFPPLSSQLTALCSWIEALKVLWKALKSSEIIRL